jgi:hypothetical protein
MTVGDSEFTATAAAFGFSSLLWLGLKLWKRAPEWLIMDTARKATGAVAIFTGLAIAIPLAVAGGAAALASFSDWNWQRILIAIAVWWACASLGEISNAAERSARQLEEISEKLDKLDCLAQVQETLYRMQDHR